MPLYNALPGELTLIGGTSNFDIANDPVTEPVLGEFSDLIPPTTYGIVISGYVKIYFGQIVNTSALTNNLITNANLNQLHFFIAGSPSPDQLLDTLDANTLSLPGSATTAIITGLTLKYQISEGMVGSINDNRLAPFQVKIHSANAAQDVLRFKDVFVEIHLYLQ
jgi:hypothetical protein